MRRIRGGNSTTTTRGEPSGEATGENPHLVEFLQRKIRGIRENGGDLKRTGIYKKAITSLILYPMPIFSGRESENLNGIGPSLSKQIDQFLKSNSHPLYPNGPPTPLREIYQNTNTNPPIPTNQQQNITNENDETQNPVKKKKSSKSKSNIEPQPQTNNNCTKKKRKRFHFDLDDDHLFDQSFDQEPEENHIIPPTNVNSNTNSLILEDLSISDISIGDIIMSPVTSPSRNGPHPPDSPYSTYLNNSSDSVQVRPLRAPLFSPAKPISSDLFSDSLIFSSDVEFTPLRSNPKESPFKSIFSPIRLRSPVKPPRFDSPMKWTGSRYIRSPLKSPLKAATGAKFAHSPLRSPLKKKTKSKADETISTSTRIPTRTIPAPTRTTGVPKFREIVCLVDNREVKSVKERDYISSKLKNFGVNSRVERLELGDFIWVAKTDGGEEWVLNYVIERKKLDDLSSSIMDGRYKEQKFRLKRSKIKNIIYLIEGNLSLFQRGDEGSSFGLPLQTLQKALASTQTSGIVCKESPDLDSTIKFLGMITNYLKDKLIVQRVEENVQEHLLFDQTSSDGHVTFDKFNQINSKSKLITVRELFALQLLQIHGCTPEKVFSIVSVYPTFPSLWTKYQSLTRSNQNPEHLLKDLQYGSKNKKIGLDISQRIFHFYQDREYEN